MNARIAAVLVLLVAVLGGGALLVRQQSGGDAPAASATLGQPVLKGLQGAAVNAIVIRQPKATLTVQKKDERWRIAERDGFPADVDKVREFVLKAISLKVGQSEPIGDKDKPRLNLDESGTRVEFLGADGKPLASLVVGKKYFKTEPDQPDKAIGDGRYVLVPSDDKRVILVSDPLQQASARTADWVSKAGINAEGVKVMEVRPAEGQPWRIERSGDNADWKLAGAGAGEKLEVTKANAASYSLSLIEIADVAPKDAKPEQTGLDKPTVVTAETFDGLTYTLRIGKPEGDNYYATVAIAGEAKASGKDAKETAERQKKLDERLPREKALAPYTLLIPKSKLEDVLKKRADLLEKKEAKK